MPPALSDYSSSSEDGFSPLTITTTTSASPKVTIVKKLTSLASRGLEDTTEDTTQLAACESSSKRLTALSAGKKRPIHQANLDDEQSVEDTEGHKVLKGRKRSRRTYPKSVSASRKHSGLLSGLDPDNVIQLSDESPASSDAKSKYRTRARVQRHTRKDLCYNMKYHPMDEVTYPRRAARMRRECGDHDSGSDINLRGGTESEVETDIEDLSGDDLEVASFPVPVRRTLRHVNQNPLYDMSLHPQDGDIAELEQAPSSPPSMHLHVEEDTDPDNEPDDVHHEGDITLDEYASLFGFDDEVNEENSTQADSSGESDKENEEPNHDQLSSPIIRNGTDFTLPPLPKRTRAKRMPKEPAFEVYVESPAAQAANMAAHPSPMYYDDFEEENVHPEPGSYVLAGAHRASSDSILGDVSPNRVQSSRSADSD